MGVEPKAEWSEMERAVNKAVKELEKKRQCYGLLR